MKLKEQPIHQPIDKHNQHPETHKGREPKLAKYFHAMMKADASDLHLRANSVPYVRVRAKVFPTQAEPVSAKEIAEMANELMTEKQAAFFEDTGNIDIAHELAGLDRFRINVFRQRGNVAIAVRRVLREVPDFNSLNLPSVLEKVAMEHHGLVLLSGASGSGKSTTIASMIEYVNQNRPCHVLTIEDPIEYLFQDKKSIVSQREIGIDCDSFETALKYLMREDPDVVLIGEMRDHETFTAALQAAETGHLVFGTVHASSSSQTIGRILDLVGPENRDVYRQALAFNLRAVICQMLLPSIADGLDRVPAIEVMLMNPSVRQFIRESREQELPEVIRNSQREGMQTFTHSLIELIDKDYIDPQVAYDVAPNAEELKMHMKGITSSQSGLIGRS